MLGVCWGIPDVANLTFMGRVGMTLLEPFITGTARSFICHSISWFPGENAKASVRAASTVSEGMEPSLSEASKEKFTHSFPTQRI